MTDNPPLSADDIVLEYELTFADYAAMVREMRSRPSRMAREAVLWVLVAINVASFTAFVADEGIAWISLAIAVLILAWRFVGESWIIRNHFAKMELGGRRGTMRADETGIHLAVGGLSSSIRWDAVQRITRTQGQLLFWISKAQAVIVPRRDLAEPGQEERLLSLATRKTGKNVE